MRWATFSPVYYPTSSSWIFYWIIFFFTFLSLRLELLFRFLTYILLSLPRMALSCVTPPWYLIYGGFSRSEYTKKHAPVYTTLPFNDYCTSLFLHPKYSSLWQNTYPALDGPLEMFSFCLFSLLWVSTASTLTALGFTSSVGSGWKNQTTSIHKVCFTVAPGVYLGVVRVI